MEITILESNITDKIALASGLALVLSSVPNFFNLKYQTTTYPFTSIPFSTTAVPLGYEVNPDEILAQGDTTEDTEFLIFDASKVNPSPLNPTCTVERGHTDAVCQMCEHWYQGNVNTFASFFLHEICHRMSFALGVQDITHLLTDGTLQAQYPALYSQFNTKQPIDYYVYLINSLMPAWNQYKAGQQKMQTLKLGMDGDAVVALQKNLNFIGNYSLVEDGNFGLLTQNALKDFQYNHGLTQDGVAGPHVFDAILCVNAIYQVAEMEAVPVELILAVVSCEGGFNSQATNLNHDGSVDRGILQWNNLAHPEINDNIAFNPTEATIEFCKAIKANPKNLHNWWSASQHCWAPKLSDALRAEYGV